MAKASHPLEANLELAALRRKITELVARNAVTMVQNTIDAVNDGQYQALKYLFEMIGLYPALSDEAASEDASLAAILLRHLGIQEIPEGEEQPQSNRGRQADPLQ